MKYWLGVAGVIVLAAVSWPVSAQSSASEFFASRVPRWFPVPKVPVDNPLTAAKVELGRFLFYDPQSLFDVPGGEPPLFAGTGAA